MPFATAGREIKWPSLLLRSHHLLLSASVKASGANLQQASNVIVLDPAGSSPEHGATLEQQAIGRAVRMGQEKAVRVVRFSVRDTVEEELYNAIDLAAAKLVTRQNDNSYTCESAHKSLDTKVLQKKKAAEDDDDVCMMESVSAKERVARQRAQAVANNEVIVIDDSDDEEEEEDSKPKALPTVKAPVANTKVKSEPIASKRTSEEIGDTESSSTSDKRAKVTEMATAQAARRVSSNPSPDLDMAPTVSNGEEATSNSNLVSQRRGVTSNKDVYLVDTGGKLHSLEAEEKEKEIEEEARVEYIKACNMERYQYNGNDNKWVMKWLELKQSKATTGVWPTTSTLGNFCKYQRDLRKKNVKGQKTTLTAGRIKMLDNIGFPWGSDITPTKQSATTLQSSSSNVVSPQEVEDASRFIEELVGNKTTSPLKDSTSQDGRITVSVVKPTREQS